MRPVIGVTTRPRIVPTSGGDLGIDSLQHTYRTSIDRAGGIPIGLSPVASADIGALLERIDGLVLSGGGDVDPARYGSEPNETMYGIDVTRDAFEFALTTAARDRRMPVLAICRGLEVVNVALGGTLIENIASEPGIFEDHVVRGDAVFAGHQHVSLDPGCVLAKVIGSTEAKVNSVHHQSVRDLADGLRVVGRADDGIIEAVESTDDWPLIAVQWHPEYLSEADDPAAHSLFSAFVDSASEYRASVPGARS